MPTSATKISEHDTGIGSPARTGGFTLLELLVVLTIVGILTGTVVLGFTGADQEQELKGAAQRLATRVELARQQSLTRNREWGIYVETDSYRFAEFDPISQVWVIQEGRPFAQNDLPERVRLRLQTDGLGEVPFAEEENLPQILLFSSGETTPFTIALEPEWRDAPWEVSSDGLSRAEAARAGEAG